MVSSRCVDGLSTGSRPVSASVTTNNAANASRWPGPRAAAGSEIVRAAICEKLVDPALSANATIDNATVGSVSATTVISRLAPMPPNGDPVSSPASARKNVPSSNRYTAANTSPTTKGPAGTMTSGTSEATMTLVPNTTNGVARNSQDAVCETTASLPNNFRISKYGCQSGAPRRPWSRALSQRMKPTSAGASASATSGCTNRATYRLI